MSQHSRRRGARTAAPVPSPVPPPAPPTTSASAPEAAARTDVGSASAPSDPSDGRPDHSAGRAVVVVLVVTALFVLTQLYAAIPLLGPVSSDLGADATFALSTGFSLAYALSFLVWGPVSDRYGRKRVMATAVGVLAVATILCATASSLPAMGVLRAVQGLAASGFAPVALAHLSEAVVPAGRAGAIGAMSTAFLVAGIFGQVLASVVALRAGWPWFFVLCGIVLAVALALILGLVTEAPRRSSPIALPRRFVDLARLMVRPTILLLSAAHVTLLLSFVALYTGIARHLEAAGVPASGVVLVRSAALPAMFLSLAVGVLAARLGTVGVARVGFAVAAAGMLGEVVFPGALPGLVAASVVHVAGVALAVPSMIDLYGRTAAPARGSGMAINGFVLFIGAGAGTLLGHAVQGFGALAAILTAVLALAQLPLLGVSRAARKGGPR